MAARNDQEYLAARAALAEKLLAKRTAYGREFNLSQTLADKVARVGTGIGTVIGAVPATRDNFGVALNAQRQLQAARTAEYALRMAEKVLQAS